jgi:hypothetical protein
MFPGKQFTTYSCIHVQYQLTQTADTVANASRNMIENLHRYINTSFDVLHYQHTDARETDMNVLSGDNSVTSVNSFVDNLDDETSNSTIVSLSSINHGTFKTVCQSLIGSVELQPTETLYTSIKQLAQLMQVYTETMNTL